MTCWKKSSTTELWGPRMDDMEEIAGAEEVCSKWPESSGSRRT